MKRSASVFMALLLFSTPAFATGPAATVDVQGDVEPGCTVVVNSVTANVNGGTFSRTAVPLDFGLNTITAIATDSAGNQTTDSVTVDVRPKINVQGTVESSVTSVTVSVIGGASMVVTPSAGTFSALIPMSLGANVVHVQAQDAAGNSNSDDNRVYLARPPVAHP